MPRAKALASLRRSMEEILNIDNKIRNLLFNAIVLSWTAIYGIICFPLLFILPSYETLELRKPWVDVILFFLKRMFNVQYEIRGLENLKKYESFIVAAKHHSPLDVLLLSKIIYRPAFVLKKKLLRIPILGLYLKASKMISVNQESATGIDVLRQMLRNAKARVLEGRIIVIYPEGERTKVGAKVGYKRGVMALYKSLKIPVIPVSLNAGMIWPKGYFDSKTPGIVIMDFAEPIRPGLEGTEFLAQLENTIETNTNDIIDNYDYKASVN